MSRKKKTQLAVLQHTSSQTHLPATGPTLRSGAGLDLGGVGGGGMPPPVTLAAPAELS